MTQHYQHPSQIVVYGQRGVGKTSFLSRLKIYWQNSNYSFLDLDQEIERYYQKKISDIFKNEGETTFRKYELEIFQQLILKYPQLVLSVGGGFDVLKIPSSVHCLWLQRVSDETGRIFTDRPRLDSNKTDLEEFFDRANIRKISFDQRADEIYFLPEGLTKANDFEEKIFSRQIDFKESTYITLTLGFIKKSSYLKKIINSGFEYRDDLIDFKEFLSFYSQYQPRKLILSLRVKDKISISENNFTHFKSKKKCSSEILIDWALELGSPKQLKNLQPDIFSLHDYLENEDLNFFLQRLEGFFKPGIHLKASPVINSYSELQIGYEWQEKDPLNRSFLPRSANGRWNWFRLFMKGRQKINFWKIAAGTAPDQPTLYEWQACFSNCQKFSAVLGSPVKHSRTPLEQQSFFSRHQMPVFGIDIAESEFDKAITFLHDLGLLACAVTSPLKKKAFELVQKSPESYQQLSTLDKELGTLNTLYFKNEIVYGTNTDLEGLEAQVKPLKLEKNSIAVWGGGGTLPIIKTLFPSAVEYSVRSGQARSNTNQDPNFSPQTIIWAAAPNATAPSFKSKIQFVIDLNYKEDSFARTYAKETGAHYISGEVMFLEQAHGQQKFWKKYLSN